MSCFNSKIVDAPLHQVWGAVRDFHELGWAKGVVESCEKLGNLTGDQIGARRKLNGVFEETLQGLNDVDHTITYTIDQGPGPLEGVRNYVGRVRLSALTDGNRTMVEWGSSWSGADNGIGEFCNPIYAALLEALAANVKR